MLGLSQGRIQIPQSLYHCRTLLGKGSTTLSANTLQTCFMNRNIPALFKGKVRRIQSSRSCRSLYNNNLTAQTADDTVPFGKVVSGGTCSGDEFGE